MKTQEVIEILEEKAFDRQEKDSGIYFSKVMEHIKLICYIEPEVEVQFITLYRWKNNDVKGTYNITVHDLMYTKKTIPEMFRNTKANLPQRIGDCVDTHKEVEEAIEYIFQVS